MSGDASRIERARQALASHDWPAAADELAPVVDSLAGDPARLEPDHAEALELAAHAAWWLGRLDSCIAHRERAFVAREAQGETLRAARLATLLYYDHCWQARTVVANGWLARARRLLDGHEPCPEHGYVAILEAESANGRGDLEGAVVQAQMAISAGRDFADPDLEADGLQCLGRILIAQGRPADGLALFDEAMLLAAEGRLGLFAVGKVYCSLISACEELADFQRAIEWTRVGVDWASPQQASPVFPGLCRVHRAEMLQREGSWDAAEAEARRAYDELCGVNLFNAGLAYYEIGEIRRRLGDLDAAEGAFAEAETCGRDPQPGLALLRLAQGRVDAAAAGIAGALAESEWNRLARAKLLPAQVTIALVAGDIALARRAAAELDDIAATYRTAGLRAAALEVAGRVALADGEHLTACGHLRRALHEWQALDLPYEVARTRRLLAEACRSAGDDEGAAASLDAAIAIFQRLGAQADLAEVNAERERTRAHGAPPPLLPCRLTEREAQVLRLVAGGRTNREVARELVLSEKTVARHLSNIFAKTGVSSRAGATAFAFEHGIVAVTA